MTKPLLIQSLNLEDIQLPNVDELRVGDLVMQVQRLAKQHAAGSLALHEQNPFSTATMQHPYTFCTDNYEKALRSHLAFIEKIKADPSYHVERADEENVCYSQTFPDEDYGEVTMGTSDWLIEVLKSEAVISAPHSEEVVIVHMSSKDQSSGLSVAYATEENGMSEIQYLVNWLKQAYPEFQTEAENYGSYHSVNLKLRDQEMSLVMESYPF